MRPKWIREITLLEWEGLKYLMESEVVGWFPSLNIQYLLYQLSFAFGDGKRKPASRDDFAPMFAALRKVRPSQQVDAMPDDELDAIIDAKGKGVELPHAGASDNQGQERESVRETVEEPVPRPEESSARLDGEEPSPPP